MSMLDNIIHEAINLRKYTAESDGSVFSENFKNQNGLRQKLKTRISNSGYEMVCISGAKGRPKRVHLHRFVWIFFNGKIPRGYVIDHIDRNRLNNNASNLRCVTYSENAMNTSFSKVTVSKINQAIADKIRREYDDGASTAELSVKYGISRTNLNCVLRNKIWINTQYAPRIRDGLNRGEKASKLKITEEDVKFIRENEGKIETKVLRDMFGYKTNESIYAIQKRRIWKHI